VTCHVWQGRIGTRRCLSRQRRARAWLAYFRIQLRLTYEMTASGSRTAACRSPTTTADALSVADDERMLESPCSPPTSGWERSRFPTTCGDEARGPGDLRSVRRRQAGHRSGPPGQAATSSDRRPPAHVDLVRQRFFRRTAGHLLDQLTEALEGRVGQHHQAGHATLRPRLAPRARTDRSRMACSSCAFGDERLVCSIAHRRTVGRPAPVTLPDLTPNRGKSRLCPHTAAMFVGEAAVQSSSSANHTCQRCSRSATSRPTGTHRRQSGRARRRRRMSAPSTRTPPLPSPPPHH